MKKISPTLSKTKQRKNSPPVACHWHNPIDNNVSISMHQFRRPVIQMFLWLWQQLCVYKCRTLTIRQSKDKYLSLEISPNLQIVQVFNISFKEGGFYLAFCHPPLQPQHLGVPKAGTGRKLDWIILYSSSASLLDSSVHTYHMMIR